MLVTLLNTKPQRTWNLFGADLLRANKPWGDKQWAATDPRASIQTVILSHPKEGTLSQNSSLSEDRAKISGFCNPEAQMIISTITLRGRIDSRSSCRAGGKSQDSHFPAWQSQRHLVSFSFSQLPAFSVLCPLWEVAGWRSPVWPVILARASGTWGRVKRKPGLFPVSGLWTVHTGRPWEVRASGSKAGLNTPLSLLHRSWGQTVNKL